MEINSKVSRISSETTVFSEHSCSPDKRKAKNKAKERQKIYIDTYITSDMVGMKSKTQVFL